MYLQQVWNAIAVLLITATDMAAACPSHEYKQRSVPLNTLRGPHVRRSDLGKLYRRAESGPRDWSYTTPDSWASIKAGMSSLLLPRFAQTDLHFQSTKHAVLVHSSHR